MPSLPARTRNGGIRGGVQSKAQPTFTGESGLLQCQGFHFDEELSLTKWRGFRKRLNNIQMDQAVDSPGTNPIAFTGLFGYKKSGIPHTYANGVVIGTGDTRTFKQAGNEWHSIRADNVPIPGAETLLFDSFVMNDVMYFGNGNDFVFKVDGTEETFNISLFPASFNPNPAPAGVGVLNGVYSYKYSNFSTRFNAESNLSAKSIDVTLVNQLVSLTGLPASTDPQVDKKRIYRTTTGGGVWLFLAEIPNATTVFVDNLPDSSLGIAGEEIANGSAPLAFNMFLEWRGFVFASQTGQSDLYFSAQNNPAAWHPNDRLSLGSGDGDTITAISELGGNPVVFKNDSIWVVFGEDRLSFEPIRQQRSVGATSHHGVVRIPSSETLMFPSEDGIYSFDGSNTVKQSTRIDSVYRSISDTNKKLIYGAIYKPLNSAMWLVRNGAGSKGDLWIIYDYIQRHWATRTVPNNGNILSVIEDENNRDVLYMGGYDGFVREADSGHQDDGLPIVSEFVTRALPLDDDTPHMKSFTTLFVNYKPQETSTLHLFAVADREDGVYQPIGDVDMSIPTGTQRLRFNMYGRRLFVKGVHSDGTPCVIRGIDLEHIEYQGRV
jgi:hypothetical protein